MKEGRKEGKKMKEGRTDRTFVVVIILREQGAFIYFVPSEWRRERSLDENDAPDAGYERNCKSKLGRGGLRLFEEFRAFLALRDDWDERQYY